MVAMQWRRGSAADWLETDRVLREGEPGFETNTGRYKIGDGLTVWSELPYFLDEQGVTAVVQGWINNGSVDLSNHISAALPHPVYDDGPSFLLLYENAKV